MKFSHWLIAVEGSVACRGGLHGDKSDVLSLVDVVVRDGMSSNWLR